MATAIEKTLGTCMLLAALAAPARPCAALQAGTELFVPAAARSSGWITDLVVMNPGDASVRVSLYWLERGRANPAPAVVSFSVAPRHTVVLDDALSTAFHLDHGEGAFRVVVKSGQVIVTSRIYLRRPGAGTVGQGFEGIPAEMAIGPDAESDHTFIAGIVHNSRYRSNFYALAGAGGATIQVVLLDAEGGELARRTYRSLGTYQPMLVNVDDLDPDLEAFDLGTLLVTVTSGSAVVGASKVDNNPASSDPTTLEAWLPCARSPGSVELVASGRYTGVVANENGFLGGIEMTVNERREVTSLSFTFPSDLCGATFGGAVTFPIPVPLADFADGVTFGPNTFTVPGQMVWTVTVNQVLKDLYLEGTLSAAGRSFTDSWASCNGDHPADRVRLGKEQDG